MEEVLENNVDIPLDFHSTSAKNGHFGSSTEYIAAEHRVVRRTWGTRRRLYDLLPPKVIPPTVEYVTSFATQNASVLKSAMISLISAPIVEEIAFRGIICRWLKKTSKAWIAILISAVFFGLWHRNLGQFAYTFVWGILLGYVFLRSGSVIWTVLIHFTGNLLAILGYSNSRACVFGAWPALVGIRVWMREWPVWASILGLVVMVIMTLFICLRIKRIHR